MIILLFCLSLICLSVTLIINFGLKKDEQRFIIFLCSSFKKRNLISESSKNTLQKCQNKQYFIYKRLKPIAINFSKNNKSLTYVEKINNTKTQELIKINEEMFNKISKNKNKYRAIYTKTIIEMVADKLSGLILSGDYLNIFSCFETLSKNFKIYKKEAEVLNALLINNLVYHYSILNKEIGKIKREIRRGSKVKKIDKNSSCAKIYGAYMFNPSLTKLCLDRERICLATSKLLSQLDEILLKQKVLYNYVKMLYKGA